MIEHDDDAVSVMSVLCFGGPLDGAAAPLVRGQTTMEAIESDDDASPYGSDASPYGSEDAVVRYYLERLVIDAESYPAWRRDGMAINMILDRVRAMRVMFLWMAGSGITERE